MRQRGFTLIEVLVTLAIGSVLLTGGLLTVNQILVSTGRSNSQVIVLDEVHRAALWIKKDIQAHSSADLIDLQSGNATFSWTDQTGLEPEDERSHYITYSLSDTELVRSTSDNITMILGRSITSVTFTNDAQDDRLVNVVITATSSTFPPRSETLTFSVYRRSEET